MSYIFTLVALAVSVQEGRPTWAIRSPVEGQDVRPYEGFESGVQELAFTLEAFVHDVLIHNLELKVAELVAESNATVEGFARGAFDPELYASASGSNQEEPTASTFVAPSNQSLDANTGLRGLGLTGLTYDLSYNFRYQRQSPSNPFFQFNPTYLSVVMLNVSQPLLRNAGTAVTTASVQRARLLVERGDFDLLQQAQITTYLAVQAYWNYVFRLRTLDTARTALEVAEQLVVDNQRRLDVGSMTRLDVTRAESEAALRQEELIQAETEVGKAEDLVKTMLNPGEKLENWRVHFVPLTEPELRDFDPPSEQEAAERAFAQRNDLRMLETDLGITDLDLMVAENSILPEFSATASYALAGLSGQTNTNRASNFEHFRESWTPIGQSDFETWSMGLFFSYPIGNHSAEASLRRARLDKQRAVVLVQQKRMQIVAELRTAIRDVQNSKARVAASRKARVLAEAQYNAEEVRLDNQHSTTFLVREAQRDLFEARDLETQAIVDHEVLLANLDAVQGTLVQKYGVDWEPPPPLEGALIE